MWGQPPSAALRGRGRAARGKDPSTREVAISGWSVYTNGTSATFPRLRQDLQLGFYEKPPSYCSAPYVGSLQQVERPADDVVAECRSFPDARRRATQIAGVWRKLRHELRTA